MSLRSGGISAPNACSLSLAVLRKSVVGRPMDECSHAGFREFVEACVGRI